MEWQTSCVDWAEKLQSGGSIIPPPIFPEQAAQALEVFQQLKIVDAPGSPTFGESCAQWVFDLVASIFGAYEPESGRRLITEWFVCLPKKNSKSTIAAGIMMTAVILNWRQSGEFAILAPTIEVANNAFAPARDMVKHDEELEDLLHVQTHIKTISHRQSDAMLKVVAADSNTVGGKKSIGTLVDELWLFGKQANAENMLREAIGGLASRPEGFVIYLTTQSDDPPAGVFKQKLQYARDVRDGKIEDKRFVPVIFEHPPEMVRTGQHLLVENLSMVNPNLGYSVDEEFLRREFQKSKTEGEASFRGFMAKHGNVEIGLALRSDRWAGADFWEHQAKRDVTFEYLLEWSEVIDFGIDGGGLDDLLGAAAVGRHKITKDWLHWAHAWAHPSVLERRKEIAPALQDFARAGSLTIVEQIGDDVEELAGIVEQVHAAGLLDMVGVDPAGLGGILDALEDSGIPKEKIVGISQGWKLGGAIKTTERKLAEGTFWHGGTGLMNWCVGNARIVVTSNAINITKQASGSAKIDPLMATFNAVSLMALNPSSAQHDFSDFLSSPVITCTQQSF
ncbi:MAG: terminase large subunit [Dyella sp.]